MAIGPDAAMVAAKIGACGHSEIALAFGLAVALIVAATGHLGGAHINPAVTPGFWSIRRFPTRDVALYIAAQCIGAIAASALLAWLLAPVGNFGATIPTVRTMTVARAFVIGIGYTGMLGFVIVAVATDDRARDTVAPFIRGATVYVGALVIGPLTGGGFNPARTLGPAVIGYIWPTHWLYWAAANLRMIAGMHLYDVLRRANLPSVALRRVVTGLEGPL